MGRGHRLALQNRARNAPLRTCMQKIPAANCSAIVTRRDEIGWRAARSQMATPLSSPPSSGGASAHQFRWGGGDHRGEQHSWSDSLLSPTTSRRNTTQDSCKLERLSFADGSVILSPYACKETRAAALKELAFIHESNGSIEQIDEFERLHPTLPGDAEEKEVYAALNREAALRTLVPALDTNEDGFIDREEMQRAMPERTDDGLDATMRACDLDGDGKVATDEWVAYVLKQQEGKDDVEFVEGVKHMCRVLEAPLHTAVAATFAAADKDNSGVLDLFEVAVILGKSARPDKGALLKEAMGSYDANLDGVLDFDEYHKLYCTLVDMHIVDRPRHERS